MCNLVSDAKPKWFELGFQLQIKEVALEVIKMENSDVQACFRKMLSTWLKMVDPLPSWEGLLTALEHDSVNCSNLARSIRQDFDMTKKTNCATDMNLSVFKQRKFPAQSNTCHRGINIVSCSYYYYRSIVYSYSD